MQYKVNIYVWLIEGAMEEKPQLDLANSKVFSIYLILSNT